MIKKIKRLLINIKLWLPILMSDEQWDNYYLHKVVYHKLSLMKDFYNSDEPMSDKEHTESVVREIDSILDVLNRVIEDDYIEFPDDVEPQVCVYDDGSGNYRLDTSYNDDFEKEYINNIYDRADKKRKDDLKDVYISISNNSEKWWD